MKVHLSPRRPVWPEPMKRKFSEHLRRVRVYVKDGEKRIKELEANLKVVRRANDVRRISKLLEDAKTRLHGWLLEVSYYESVLTDSIDHSRLLLRFGDPETYKPTYPIPHEKRK